MERALSLMIVTSGDCSSNIHKRRGLRCWQKQPYSFFSTMVGIRMIHLEKIIVLIVNNRLSDASHTAAMV